MKVKEASRTAKDYLTDIFADEQITHVGLEEPERSRFFNVFRYLIEKSKEIVVPSAVASRNSLFGRLGLTEAALLEVVSAETPLITVDSELYLAALAKEQEAAFNFTHLQFR